MEKIKLYIDEDLSDRIAVALRSKGYNAKGISHSGMVVTDYLLLKELIRRITSFLNVRQRDEIKNNLDWLQNYK
ncbi:MAG: hypothetical protein VST71_11675 [Nitrospirota bacterium]|nr:hypothetical protein [Nitrospirota bacterium]